MFAARFLMLSSAALLMAGSLLPAQELAGRLARLDATVAPPEQREALTRMVSANLRQRLQAANERSSADWHKIASRADWEQYVKPRLGALRASLGQFPEPPRPLEVRKTGTIEGKGYRIDKVVFQSRPGLWVTANLYRPESPPASLPGLLLCHAHHTPKEHGELQDMGVLWARAGCLVLVMDQLGHGERRQHSFLTAADFGKPFGVGRQDYYFRHDVGLQLHLVGESLAGWIAWDLMRGVDLLLAQPGIDPKRIILLGAVAGGGDPTAVAGALDERITAVVPFNFGGPQPETRYPLPADAETSFNYAGGGSWESTRNLRRSAADGFLPWVIVGGIAPRRLIYGHEFSWDREHDPVWKRLEAIYGYYGMPDHLAFSHGKGLLQGKPPEASHCTHIGPLHRQLIHAALKRWFDIDMSAERETSDRHPAQELRCLTPELIRELGIKPLHEILDRLAGERLQQAQARRAALKPEERRRQLAADWARVLGPVQPENAGLIVHSRNEAGPLEGGRQEHVMLTMDAEPAVKVPLVLLLPRRQGQARVPVVVMVAQHGKQALLRQRSTEIAALLEGGAAVCLPDLRGMGETSSGNDRGRRSTATAQSSSEQMLGGTFLGTRLRDLRGVLAWLRARGDVDAGKLAVWGTSLTPVNAPDTNYRIPRDSDDALPAGPEPAGAMLALLTGLFEDDLAAVYAQGGLASYRSVLASQLVLTPHDAIVPGMLTVSDVGDLVSANRSAHSAWMVDGLNRRVPTHEQDTPAHWLLERLAKP
jgi:dienelactone hydrolase